MRSVWVDLATLRLGKLGEKKRPEYRSGIELIPDVVI
jgi:hypothetical protein